MATTAVEMAATETIPDTWQQTILWARLDARGDHPSKTMLPKWMHRIETVLRVGGTTPLTFTLHDNQHSYRVAQWMPQIIPTKTLEDLSSYELAFLLMSAYLHDIGMTPREARTRAIKSFLLSNTNSADNAQMEDFRLWVAENRSDLVLPLDPASAECQQLVEQLTAQYIRDRHNLGSAEWVREQPEANEPLGTFAGWADDLIRLCQSHHWGFDELKSETFQPRRVGSRDTVNFRYMAAVLRVADVLDVHPERTPKVLERIRLIDDTSRIFWEKDRGLSVEIRDNQVFASATPPTALIQYAIGRTLDQIDAELRLCRRLQEEGLFGRAILGKLPHAWELNSSVLRDIITPGNYKYIDSRFRADERHILEILSNKMFQSNPLATLSELVTNAFDAVQEQLAYERLSSGKTKSHSVTLRFERDKEATWLVCADDGAGMTRDLIENHFLVCGALRKDIKALQWRCRNSGFPLGRSGRFGLGVLSYFSIADRLELRTQRSPEALAGSDSGSPAREEREAWFFQTDGIHAFGELQENRGALVGCEIRLRLRRDLLVRGTEDFTTQAANLLKRQLYQPPCEFNFDAGDGTYSYRIGPEEPPHPDMAARFMEQLPRTAFDPNLSGNARRLAAEAEEQRLRGIADEIGRRVRWCEQKGELRDCPGRYRIELPFFELAGGASLAFLRATQGKDEIVLEPIVGGATGWLDAFAWAPALPNRTACNGIEVYIPVNLPGLRVLFHPRVTIDFITSGVESALGPGEVISTETGTQSVRWVMEQSAVLIRAFLNENKNSTYATLNAHLAGVLLPPGSKMHWISPVPQAWDEQTKSWTYPRGLKRTWLPAQFPALAGDDCGSRWRWKGCDVEPLPQVQMAQASSVSWNSSVALPDRVVLHPKVNENTYATLIPLWTGERQGRLRAVGPAARFSTQWRQILGVHEIWNLDHPIVEAIRQEDMEWWQRQRWDAWCNPIPLSSELLAAPGKAAAWIAMAMTRSGATPPLVFWRTLIEEHASFLSAVWAMLLQSQEPIAYLGWSLLMVSPKESREIDLNDVNWPKEFGDPAEEWVLTPK